MKFAMRWGAPVVAVVFFSLWCVGEAGRMGGSFLAWNGGWPLVLMTLAIAIAAWIPWMSLSLTLALLVGQLSHVIPAMEPNHWAIYVGSFVALAFILWTAPKRMRYIAAGVNVVAAAVMTYLMLSWRYGDGVGWYRPSLYGDRGQLLEFGWQLFALLLLMAAACSAGGLLLALYQERRNLVRSQELTRNSLHEIEIDLVVEQERTRIARDLHDVLAHSLAVIAAQADGARYLSKDQPPAVLNALETISISARRALVDAQRVIEGVREDGMVTPQPQLSDVPALIEGMQRGSLKIQHGETGRPVDLSAGQEVAAFRIIQECLTNALKHGGRGTDVRLHLDWSGPGLTLHVASTIASSDHDKSGDLALTRVGRGLPGMRERAHLAGGWLSAGPDGEHFRVTVFIPYGTRASNLEDETAQADGWNPVAAVAGIDAKSVMAGAGLSSTATSERNTDNHG
ncbi:MAG: histidine kinase [Micrococcaceae bacterium]|nr:histidine kinase [Micrococcaceae bacterium]